MKELRLKDRDVADRSKGLVTYGTVNNIVNGKNEDVQLGSLYGIALGIEVPLEHLIAITLDYDPNARELMTPEEQDLVVRLRHVPFEMRACLEEIIVKVSGIDSPGKLIEAPVRMAKDWLEEETMPDLLEVDTDLKKYSPDQGD
jgi:hypothetical protein